jgi:type I restriction enzyme, S subunit
MSEWKEYSLKEITSKIGSGATPRGGKESYYDEGISLIRSQNVLDFVFSNNGLAFIDENQALELKNVAVNENDILLNITGDSVARVCKVPKEILPARVNQHVCIIRSKENIVDSDFVLYYLLNSNFKRKLLQIASDGATRNALTKIQIEKLCIKMPSLPEQKAISNTLSCLDRKIENLRKQNETLEEIARSIFKHWFINFEFPNADGKPYKSSGGVMVRSELGDIPEGWHVGKLGDFGRIITGKTPSTQSPELWGDKLAFVTPTDFKNYGKYILNSERKISEKAISQFEKYIIPENSIVVTCIGSDMGKVTKTAISCMTNQQINSIVFSHKCFSCEYVFNYLRSQYSLLRNIALGGSTMPIINKSSFSEIDITVPAIETMALFEQTINPFNKKYIVNETQIQTLIKTRDTLLPKLMNGQLRINI